MAGSYISALSFSAREVVIHKVYGQLQTLLLGRGCAYFYDRRYYPGMVQFLNAGSGGSRHSPEWGGTVSPNTRQGKHAHIHA